MMKYQEEANNGNYYDNLKSEVDNPSVLVD